MATELADLKSLRIVCTKCLADAVVLSIAHVVLSIAHDIRWRCVEAWVTCHGEHRFGRIDLDLVESARGGRRDLIVTDVEPYLDTDAMLVKARDQQTYWTARVELLTHIAAHEKAEAT